VDLAWRYPDGRRERVRVASPVNTRLGAEQYERQVIASLIDGTYKETTHDERPRTIPTLTQWSERFLQDAATNNKPGTADDKASVMRHHLLPTMGRLRLDAIGAGAVEEYKARKLAEGLKAKTVNNHLAYLSRALSLAVDLGELSASPRIRLLKAPKPAIGFLEPDEAIRLLGAAKPEQRCFIMLCLRAGLRVSEAVALRWDDVDLDRSQLVVRRSAWKDGETSPKSGRSRTIPLAPDLLASLKEQRMATFMRGPWVLCRANGTRLSRSVVRDWAAETCRRAGLSKRITTHGLRHSFGSHLGSRGVHPRVIQELMGHSTVAMAMRYVHLAELATREAVQLLVAPSAEAQGRHNEAAETAAAA
jgi:integrase